MSDALKSEVMDEEALKQALYVREQLPESEVTIYYIDRRTPGRNEAMLQQLAVHCGDVEEERLHGRVVSDGPAPRLVALHAVHKNFQLCSECGHKLFYLVLIARLQRLQWK